MKAIVPAALLLLTACGSGAAGDPDFAAYRGETLRYGDARLRFPIRSVEAIQREGGRLAWARLVPGGLSSNDLIERYLIDIGRADTGRQGPSGYQLGSAFFIADDERTDVGDGYTLHCTRPDQRVPAFNCAAPLKSLPRAAIAFARVPASVEQARVMVAEAEAFLRQATLAADGAAGSASRL